MNLPLHAPRVTDSQHSAVRAAEAAVGDDTLATLEQVEEVCLDSGLTLAQDDSGEVRYERDRARLVVGRPALLREVLHAAAHHRVHPVFPAHGFEWRLEYLELLERFGFDSDLYRREFTKRHAHVDLADRLRRARKTGVGVVRSRAGALGRVICDDPPESFLGQLTAIEGTTWHFRTVDDERTVDESRLRYVSFEKKSTRPA